MSSLNTALVTLWSFRAPVLIVETAQRMTAYQSIVAVIQKRGTVEYFSSPVLYRSRIF